MSPRSPFPLLNPTYLSLLLQVDTAVLTGEPFPRKVPGDIEDLPEEDEVKQTQPGENGQREGKEDEGNNPCRALFAGCVVKSGEAYCLVQKTGLNTEIGTAAKVRIIQMLDYT